VREMKSIAQRFRINLAELPFNMLLLGKYFSLPACSNPIKINVESHAQARVPHSSQSHYITQHEFLSLSPPSPAVAFCSIGCIGEN